MPYLRGPLLQGICRGRAGRFPVNYIRNQNIENPFELPTGLRSANGACAVPPKMDDGAKGKITDHHPNFGRATSKPKGKNVNERNEFGCWHQPTVSDDIENPGPTPW